MKILLTTLNSKYIHSALSIRYLKAYTSDIPMELREFTINQNIEYIVGEIYKMEPDVVSFSTYIWNRNETLAICETLKIVHPDIKIILGGPEVSFDAKDLMEDNPFIDYIIYGEGEKTFDELIRHIVNEDKGDLRDIDGIVFRDGNSIVETRARELICNLDEIPSPYKAVGDEFENKIVYFESSRGCPFNCQFCLSSTIKGLRFFSLERVLDDLSTLIDARVKQVKFVDRTFNANKEYAMSIMNFIMEKDPENMNFHFEVTAHLLDDEMLDFISKAKKGLFQFEIGVQSTNEKTLKAVGRNMEFEKLKEITRKIERYGNIHQHLDLIAGLPYEGYDSFKKSFNDVYSVGVEKIQLGFLKLLKGSGLRNDQDKYGFKYLDLPPYEVLETDWLSYGEMIRLKGIEDLVEKYHNEEYFRHTTEFIIKNYFDTPFDFFEDLLGYWEERDYHTLSHGRNRLYSILVDYYIERGFNRKLCDELIKYDYFSSNINTNPPSYIKRQRLISQEEKHELLKDKKLLGDFFPDYLDRPTKRLVNKLSIESFDIDIISLIDKDYSYDDSMARESSYIFDYSDGVENTRVYNIDSYLGR